MLKLYKASAEKYYFFEDEITQKVKNRQTDYLALLPVNRAVRQLKWRLTEAAPENTIIDANIFTFNETLLKIYQRLPGAKRIIQTETQRLFVSRILRDKREDFSYFPVKQTIPESSAVKIADTVAELRRFGYSAKRFDKADFDDASDKKKDFRLLLKYLEEALQPSLIDEPFALYSAADKLDKESFFKLFPEVSSVYISGYELFTPAMKRFIENTKDWLDINLKITYNEQNTAAFKHVKEAWEQFAAIADEIIDEEHPKTLTLRLLNHGADDFPAEKPDKRYFIHKLKTRKDEIAFIAALARQLNHRDKIPLHRIAVTFANLERYVPLIRTVFSENGLPYNLSTGFRLNQSPLVQTFISVLSFTASGYETKKALELLNNNSIKIDNRLRLSGLFKYLARYRIEFLSPASLNVLKERLQRDNENPQLLTDADSLSRFLHPFFDFPKSGSITLLRNAYIALLKNTGLLDWYKSDSGFLSERDREKEFRAYNRFMKVFDKFVWSYQQMAGEENIALNDFIRYLQSQINNASYNLAEKSEYGVQINPRLEVQALSYDVLIVGGMIDGEFPRESVKDVFFNDPLRKKMGLAAAEDLLDQDRFIFYSLLDSQAKTVYMTYPEYDSDHVLPPSTFIGDFLELYPETGEDDDFDEQYLLTGAQYRRALGGAIYEGNEEDALRTMEILLNAGGEPFKETLKNTLRQIEIQKMRTSGDSASPFEGNISGSAAVEEFLHKKYDNAVWSASRLEEYAFCPMKFFYNRILKIEPWPEIEEEFTPLERGNLLHKILFRFYSQLKNKERPADQENLLIELAREELAHLPYRGFFAELEEKRYCGSERGGGFLRHFINYDQQQINEIGYIPAHFELAFGSDNKKDCDPASVSEPLTIEADGRELRLQGRIDRIDINDAGVALVFDYKTGTSAKSAKAPDAVEGLAFQIPLYMSALPQLLKDHSAAYGGYYIIKDKDKDNCIRYALLADKDSAPKGRPKNAYLPNKYVVNEADEPYNLDEVLELNVKQAVRRAEEIISGNFRHSFFPDNQACQSYCDFRRMCRKNSAKMKRMAEVRHK